jgi:Mrp family chromosome partitioning ATPase
LTLLPAGRPLESPSELLSSEKMRQLMTELKSRYPDRFLVLDSPPINFIAETASLTAMADVVLLVVRSGKTARELIQDAITTIGKEKISGVVFNSSAEVQKDLRFYYRYYRKGK